MYYLLVETTICTGGTDQRIPQRDFYPLTLLLDGLRFVLKLYDPKTKLTIEYDKTSYNFEWDSWYAFDRSLNHLHTWYISFYTVLIEHQHLHRAISLVEEIHSSLSALKDPSTWELGDLRISVDYLTFDDLEKLRSHK